MPKGSPFVVIRVPVGHTNVVLKFGLLNASASQNDIVDDSTLAVDVPYLNLLMLKSEPTGSLQWSSDPAWKKEDLQFAQSLYFKTPSLLPGFGEPAPGITFEMPTDFSEQMYVQADIRGKGVPIIILQFQLVFIRSNEVIGPSFHTNNIAAVKLIGPARILNTISN